MGRSILNTAVDCFFASLTESKKLFSHLKGDLFGGVTAAVVALPLALAFGVSSGAGALAGLYGAIFAGALAAVLGGTRVQVTGPTGPMTVVMALVVTHFHDNLSAAFAVVILAGFIQVLFGLAGIGRYIRLVPYPVVSGFMSGIGVIIIILQIPALLGQSAEGSILSILSQIPQLSTTTNIGSLTIGVAIILIMFFAPAALARIIPKPLIALIAGSLVVGLFSIPVPLIGAIPTGVPTIILPEFNLSDVETIIRFALVLAFLGSIDSLLTSLVADSITRTEHNSNRELIGQGIGNMTAGFFGGLPSAGATMRTLVNVRAGGKSSLSGLIHSILLLAVVFGFDELVSHIPLAVLAGILVKVGIDIIDWHSLRRMNKIPRADLAIMLVTLILTILVDLMTAFAVGFVMASVMFVSKMAEVQISNAKIFTKASQIEFANKEETAILDQFNHYIALLHLEGPLSFGSARDIARLLNSNTTTEILILDLSDVPFIDSSATTVLHEVVERLNGEGDTVLIFGARESVRQTMVQTGIWEQLGEKNIFDHRLEALEQARRLLLLSSNSQKAGKAGDSISR
jgi:SulP family sulfate permease